MNLVFIYGPPAVGKLSVAKVLSTLTGYTLFHNHLTYDFIHDIFGNINTDDLNHRVRLEVFRQAVKSDLPGMIFTFVYGYGLDEDFVKSVIEIIESGGGHIYFVQLDCEKKVLYQRVTQESRKLFKKINSPEQLDNMLKKYNIVSTIPTQIHSTLTVDNTSIAPEQVAKKIIKQFQL